MDINQPSWLFVYKNAHQYIKHLKGLSSREADDTWQLNNLETYFFSFQFLWVTRAVLSWMCVTIIRYLANVWMPKIQISSDQFYIWSIINFLLSASKDGLVSALIFYFILGISISLKLVINWCSYHNIQKLPPLWFFSTLDKMREEKTTPTICEKDYYQIAELTKISPELREDQKNWSRWQVCCFLRK